jgi:hypothetical protein
MKQLFRAIVGTAMLTFALAGPVSAKSVVVTVPFETQLDTDYGTQAAFFTFGYPGSPFGNGEIRGGQQIQADVHWESGSLNYTGLLFNWQHYVAIPDDQHGGYYYESYSDYQSVSTTKADATGKHARFIALTPRTEYFSKPDHCGSVPCVQYFSELWFADFNASFSGTNGTPVSGYVTFTITPVPEPATWAMMVVGFGLGGAAIRRSRDRRTMRAS